MDITAVFSAAYFADQWLDLPGQSHLCLLACHASHYGDQPFLLLIGPLVPQQQQRSSFTKVPQEYVAHLQCGKSSQHEHIRCHQPQLISDHLGQPLAPLPPFPQSVKLAGCLSMKMVMSTSSLLVLAVMTMIGKYLILMLDLLLLSSLQFSSSYYS